MTMKRKKSDDGDDDVRTCYSYDGLCGETLEI